MFDEQETKHICVLSRKWLPTMFTILRQRRLGHVRRMEDNRIPKDILYGAFIAGKRDLGRTQSRDMCKRVMKELNIDLSKWDEISMDHSKRSYFQATLNERYSQWFTKQTQPTEWKLPTLWKSLITLWQTVSIHNHLWLCSRPTNTEKWTCESKKSKF